MLLEIDALEVRYGATRAVKGVSIAAPKGEAVALLGANGAGKSSVLRAAAGVAPIAKGAVKFDGVDFTRKSAASRPRNGLVLVPEGRQIFISMTVEENLLFGAYSRPKDAELRRDMEALYARFTNLAERRRMSASVLSGGEQQMLAIARALLARPKLMMLDEPSLGLSPRLVDHLFDLLVSLKREGLALLLVEQNTELALSICEHAYVLELGEVKLSGEPATLRAAPELRAAYLGETAT